MGGYGFGELSHIATDVTKRKLSNLRIGIKFERQMCFLQGAVVLATETEDHGSRTQKNRERVGFEGAVEFDYGFLHPAQRQQVTAGVPKHDFWG
jgi:hypothetical protein